MLPQFRPHSSANEERAYFAKALVKTLRERDMNQSELGRKTGLSRDAISSYVRARSMPEPKNLRKIADALQVETTVLTMPAEHDANLVRMPLLMPDTSGDITPNGMQLMVRDGGTAHVVMQADLPIDVALELVKSYQRAINEASNRD